MKKLILVMGCAVMASCNESGKKEYSQIPPKEPTKIVLLHVQDYTQSGDGINYFDSSAATHLFSSLSTADEATIKLVGVYENSAKQNVFSMRVERTPDTITKSESNIYKKARIEETKRKLTSQFEEKLRAQIAQYCSLSLKPHTEKFTDLSNALALAQTTLKQPIYSKEYHKYLLICSDCINDPQGKRLSALQPLHIPRTTVLIVRPKLSDEELSRLFPLSHVYTFTDVNDAIEMIK